MAALDPATFFGGSWDPWDGLTDRQLQQLRDYERRLLRINRKHNLVSPTAAAHFRAHHVTHVLALRRKSFPKGAVVVDWGTGGGLPAVPLAIVQPEVTVHAVDAVRKKTQAVQMIARRLELTNLQCWHGRAEAWDGAAHYSVSRATAPLAELWQWHLRVAEPMGALAPTGASEGIGASTTDNQWAPGLICFKGGDLREEVAHLRESAPGVQVHQYALSGLAGDDYFQEKVLVTVHASSAIAS